ncbi:MAG: EAL domain-containing protein [Gammaproteobacteria bacterium]|nr:EAL domain-containing protein [Gammaproteobacteria bacterium]
MTDSEALRILIVDDDVTALMMMAEALGNAGYDVVEASNGVEALKEFRERSPDLVLLDIEMPELDGFSACEQMRHEASRDNLPIVMVTGLDDSESIQRAFRAGATDFIIKPINWPLFIHRIESILASAATRVQLISTTKEVDSLRRVTPDIALLVRRDGSIIEHLGHDAKPCLATNETLASLWPKRIATTMLQRVKLVLKTRKPNYFEFELGDRDDHRYFEARFLVDGRNRVLVIVQQVATRTTETEAYRLAYFDPVTELPNRNRFQKDAAACLADARLREHRLTLLSFEFDVLDKIDDGLDRDLKEAILRAVAERLLERIGAAGSNQEAETSGDGNMLTRLSSNHFAVLATDIGSRQGAAELAGQIAGDFEPPIRLGQNSIQLEPTIGIAMFPEDGGDINALMAAADAAVQDARVGEQAGPRFFSDLGRSSHDRIDRAAELNWALANGQLELHYQPRVAVASGRVVGVEALLRWQHPLRGFVPLAEWMPLAEATGLIREIGEFVLEKACGDAAGRRAADGSPLRVSIHLSSQEFLRAELLTDLERFLAQTGMQATNIEFELTEKTLMRAQDPARVLHALTALGTGLMLDNFGTGYSSLAVLRDFPIGALKIDRSFVQRLAESQKDAAICRVIIETAHTLGLRAVAEGVERQDQAEFLGRHGCDEMQGFLVAAPLPLTELDAFLAAPAGKRQRA